MSEMRDFSFQGKVYIGSRLSSGKSGGMRWVDDASELTLSLETETTERQESYSGQRLTSVRLQKAKKASFTLVLNSASAENLALALQGTVTDKAGASVTNEVLPTLAVGEIAQLDYPRISSLVITDSTGSPVTATLGTHYSIESALGGLIKILSLSGLVQPLKAAYTYAAHKLLTMFTSGVQEKYIIMDGINTVDNERVRIRIYRAQFDPISELGMIQDDLGNLNFTGSILYDDTNAADANLGGFASCQLPDEA